MTTRTRVALSPFTHAVMQRLNEDRGPKGHVGIVLSLHASERSAGDAAQSAVSTVVYGTPIDVIQLPTRTAVGGRLYYRRVLVLETWTETDPWTQAERALDRLRDEQKDEPGDNDDYEPEPGDMIQDRKAKWLGGYPY